jgi:hypothetical protein
MGLGQINSFYSAEESELINSHTYLDIWSGIRGLCQ